METIEPKEGVTTIGTYAFAGCPNLSTLVWPTSIITVEVKLIELNVFKYCTKLRELAGSDRQDVIIAYLKSTTPLIELCINDSTLEQMKRAVHVDTGAAKRIDANGRSPLSFAISARQRRP